MSSTVSEARIKRAFATFDYNNKGHITHDELERILRALGFRGMSKQLVATFMRTTSTRKNPSEVTYGDLLRIVQSSGFDHIFEESFQVCQVLDKAETGRIVPAAMAKAAKADGRFDAYINPSDVAEANPHSPIGGLRRASLAANPSGFPVSRGAFSNSFAATPTKSNAIAAGSSDNLDDDELTAGGDRRRGSVTGGGEEAGEGAGKPLGIPLVDADTVLTTSRTPLAPASAKRQKLFSQIHRFLSRAEDTSPALYTTGRHGTGGLGGGYGSPTSAANGNAALGSSGTRQMAALGGAQQQEKDAQDVIDTALTFDEWRFVQTSAEKANEAETRRRRRNMPPQGASTSLSGTMRGLSSSGMSTPRGGAANTSGVGISLSCSRYDR